MMRYDAEGQRWVDDEAEARRAREHAESVQRQRQALKVTFAVLAVCGLAFGTWALGWRDEPEPPPEARPVPSASATAGTPAPGGTPTGQDGGLGSSPTATASPTAPDGYTLEEDPAGFRIAVPEDWARRSQTGDNGHEVVFYENGDASRQLQVFWVEDADAYSSLQLAEKNAERNKDYRRISLERVGDDGAAARFEYSYRSQEHGGTRHVVDHRFRAADSQLYAIVAYGQAKGAPQDQEADLVDAALASFCPTGADCPAPEGSTTGEG